MRLTRYQIDAILDEIDSRKKDLTAKKKAELIKKFTPEAKALAKKTAAAIAAIPRTVRYDILYGSEHTVPVLTKRFLKKKMDSVKPETPLVNREDLRRKIILASIDATTVEELKRKLNIKF